MGKARSPFLFGVSNAFWGYFHGSLPAHTSRTIAPLQSTISLFLRASIAILLVSALAFADSTPFTITVASTNSTLNGMHAYINDPTNELDTVLLFATDPAIAPTNFNLDNSGTSLIPRTARLPLTFIGSHLFAHTPYAPYPLPEANTNNDAYDEPSSPPPRMSPSAKILPSATNTATTSPAW
ncbi:hypothetical protein BDZ45DRAFT_727129 [Acephala macrosclerotiorum]|nr:hypothetical protein BDZ45DRAFT_727129 [Acephala macrosclerotiorum]